MKRLITCIFIVSLVIINMIVDTADAETLGSLKTQLQEQERALQDNQEEKKLTEEEIKQVNENIATIKNEIVAIAADVKAIEESITKMNQEIIAKEKEMKEIMRFVQLSSGEPAYLEYAFGAQTFTDFIYRMAISEQLTSYNDQLIKEYNQMIADNQKKKQELEIKNQQLAVKQDELSKQMSKLNIKLTQISDTQIDIKDQIKFQKDLIQLYLDKGCKDNEDIKTCGRSYLPRDTNFWRPLTSGRVSSEYGYRDFINGIAGSTDHTGLDMTAGKSTTTPVYAAASGMVSAVFKRLRCGGNEVFIHHNINGQTYTTQYAHLLSINVSVGDIVTKNSVVGIMGGGPETWGWDSCSTGYHVHFMIGTGLWGVDYKLYDTFVARSFNPRQVINAPQNHYTWWNDRLTKY